VSKEAVELFGTFGIGVALVLIVGFYSVLTTRNLIRVLIGMEVLIKAVTLLIILSGYTTGQVALAQALAITLIIIEVAVVVVAIGVVLCIYQHSKTLDTSTLNQIKG
jgi:NADH:ubiquinone oxidoreductase subunit K